MHYVFACLGANRTYPNEVVDDGDTLLYCYSPTASANAAMRRAFDEGSTFLVKVVPDRSPSTYLWSSAARVAALEDSSSKEERRRRRFVIRRAPPSDPPSPSSVPPPSSSSSPAPPPMPLAPSPAEDDTAAARRSSDECEEADVKRPRASFHSQEIVVDGVVFHSKLEYRHELMMRALGMEVEREAVTVKIDHLRSYTPDFAVVRQTVCRHVARPEGDVGEYSHVEIKPCYPYDDEMDKARAAARRLRCGVVIMYNSCFRPPFGSARPKGAACAYGHARGVRACASSRTAPCATTSPTTPSPRARRASRPGPPRGREARGAKGGGETKPAPLHQRRRRRGLFGGRLRVALNEAFPLPLLPSSPLPNVLGFFSEHFFSDPKVGHVAQCLRSLFL